MTQPQLQMERPSLDGLPEVIIPTGYRIRAYRPGDEAAWCRVVNEAIGGDLTEDDFEREMSKVVPFEAADLLFAMAGEKVVGTAWARRAKHAPERTGYVHMVAVAPEHRRRGLGRALALSTLHRFREMELRSAVLETDDFRLAAIRLYLGFAFQPKFTHDSHQARWRQVYRKLRRDEERIAG